MGRCRKSRRVHGRPSVRVGSRRLGQGRRVPGRFGRTHGRSIALLTGHGSGQLARREGQAKQRGKGRPSSEERAAEERREATRFLRFSAGLGSLTPVPILWVGPSPM